MNKGLTRQYKEENRVRNTIQRSNGYSKFALRHNYLVTNVEQSRKIVSDWLKKYHLNKIVKLGLPEIDDRYHVWRVPLVQDNTKLMVGEATIDAKTSLILSQKTTTPEKIESRILKKNVKGKKIKSKKYVLSSLRNTIAYGDAEKILDELPAESIDLVFTSPPYYNARLEYSEYETYEDYLFKLKKVIHKIHRVLREGCFFVINISPVLIRRSTRTESSKRIAIPFDIHQIFISEGFDFMDDIIWEKPEGAGWATGRGRRFAADRNPLQYKPVPVTEYVLVYRKHAEHLIDWHIRSHPDKKLVNESKILGNYDKTNIWKIKPAHSKLHPAIFPPELVRKVIRYYSFKNDVVLDPFAGIGTVADVAFDMQRRFVIIESEKKYVDIATEKLIKKMGSKAKNIFFLNHETD